MKQIPGAESQHSGGEEVFVFPLSFAQERLWFTDQLLPGNRLFNLNTALRLRTVLEVDALERSINEIVRRHETLRTRFKVIDFQPVQVVVPSLRLKVPLVDLSGLPPAERECEATRLANEEAQRPFDLTQSPLLRVSLLRLGRKDHVLLVTMHQVSYGWSMGIFGTSCRQSCLHLRKAGRRRYRSCRCNTPTSRSGSASGSKERSSTSSFHFGKKPCWRTRYGTAA
jgi:hypothetical protein